MGFKITLDKKIQKLLDTTTANGYVPQVRKEFSKRGPIKTKQAIIQDMIKGISPVKGGGKWKKYSDSYKGMIRGSLAFRTINGKVIPFTTKGITGKGSAKKRRRMKQLIADMNKDFLKSASPTKRISPVNLRLSGDMHRSSFAKTTGGFLRSFRMVIGFKSKLADIHNRLGAGKSKVVRRVLPTKGQERFNKRITTVIINELQKAADVVAKKLSSK